MKRSLLTRWIVFGLLAPAGAMANSTAPLKLDSYYNWSKSYTPSVTSSFDILQHVHYVATVSGTLSYYPAIDYSHPQSPWTIVCGKPEPSTQLPGSAGGNGPVGFDAEFIFARPSKVKKCSRYPLPVHWAAFQADSGDGWGHPSILGSWLTAPSANHTYSYAILGNGTPVSFRLHDVYTRTIRCAEDSVAAGCRGGLCLVCRLRLKSLANCQAKLPAA